MEVKKIRVNNAKRLDTACACACACVCVRARAL